MNLRCFSTLVVFLLWSCAASALVAQSSRMRFVHWTYQDAGGLLQSLDGHSARYFLGGAVLLGASLPVDPSLLEEVQESYHGPLGSYLNYANELGDPHMTPVVAGVFVFSLALPDARLQDAAFTSFQSLVYAGIITGTLKGVFGRFRPEAGQGAYQFAPFSGHTSFPSGHTTAAFAILTPWVFYYPNVATYALFALCTGTAVARIALDKHWPSDVLAGGAIGFLTARYLTRRHLHHTGPSRLKVVPFIGLASAGLRLHIRLD